MQMWVGVRSARLTNVPVARTPQLRGRPSATRSNAETALPIDVLFPFSRLACRSSGLSRVRPTLLPCRSPTPPAFRMVTQILIRPRPFASSYRSVPKRSLGLLPLTSMRVSCRPVSEHWPHPGLGSPLAHLHRDWARPCPHPHRDWAIPQRHMAPRRTLSNCVRT